MMLKGEGGPQSYIEGVALIGKAAEQGLGDAMGHLNDLAATDFDSFKREALRDGDSGKEYVLTRCCSSTEDVPKDLTAARSWFKEKNCARDFLGAV